MGGWVAVIEVFEAGMERLGRRALPEGERAPAHCNVPSSLRRPCLLQDNVHVSFESIIDLTKFTLRIPQADAEQLPDILLAVSEERRQEMRRHLARVWQKCVFAVWMYHWLVPVLACSCPSATLTDVCLLLRQSTGR